MLYPLTFRPVFKERVWGGRNLERLYRKPLPPAVRIGESWEITDRTGDVSVIANGPLAGKDLRWLMEHHERDLLGGTRSQNGRFPLLIKILDAQEKLSLQVHPPPHKAGELGGEPKTELWYITQTSPGAELFVGLKRGVTRADFERKLAGGAVAECFHRVPVRPGDAMFLPSGRVHALGAGIVLFEIQQDSDTTYRVFDWERVGLDGKPRALHVEQSLASIDFNDFEPALVDSGFSGGAPLKRRVLAHNPLFTVEEIQIASCANVSVPAGQLQIIGVVTGGASLRSDEASVTLAPGGFGLIPAGLRNAELRITEPCCFLCVTPGS